MIRGRSDPCHSLSMNGDDIAGADSAAGLGADLAHAAGRGVVTAISIFIDSMIATVSPADRLADRDGVFPDVARNTPRNGDAAGRKVVADRRGGLVGLEGVQAVGFQRPLASNAACWPVLKAAMPSALRARSAAWSAIGEARLIDADRIGAVRKGGAGLGQFLVADGKEADLVEEAEQPGRPGNSGVVRQRFHTWTVRPKS